MSVGRTVDVHSHVLPRELIDAIRSKPRDFGMTIEGSGAAEIFMRDDRHSTPLHAEFHEVEAKLESMDRKRIDISVISVTPVVFFYWLDADAGLAASRIMNDGIARMVAERPDRLRGMATLPMQDVDAAIAELERVVKEHGFRSIELGCRVISAATTSAISPACRSTRRSWPRTSCSAARSMRCRSLRWCSRTAAGICRIRSDASSMVTTCGRKPGRMARAHRSSFCGASISMR